MSDDLQQPITEIKQDQVHVETLNPNTQPSIIPDITQDEDWRRVREQRKADRKAREEAEARAAQKAEEASALKAALEALANKPSPTFNTTYQEDDSEDARLDRLVEAKMLKLERQREEERQKKEIQESPHKIRKTHTDFDIVCSQENLDYIDYYHPEVTAPFKYMPDGYEKWDAMYKVAKKLLPNQNVKKDSDKIQKNFSKPNSISSINAIQKDNPAVKLTEERRRQNWERMQKQLKGLS